MSSLLRTSILLGAVLLVTACTHSIHLVHVSDFEQQPKNAGKMVRARTEQRVILGFVQSTDYVNIARKKLEEQCRNGTIQGITTQFSTSHSFFSWTNKIYMQGLCLKGDGDGKLSAKTAGKMKKVKATKRRR